MKDASCEIRLEGSFLPPDFVPPHPLEYVDMPLGEGVVLRQVAPTPELLSSLCKHLRQRGRDNLMPMATKRIVEVLDAAAALWLGEKAPDYDAVLRAMAVATGLSLPMTRESSRREQESSRAPEIWATLKAEFGDPGVLEGFRPRPGTGSLGRALGPELCFCVLPGNIPALSHLSFMRCLLLRSPLLAKTASAEPVYAAAYARTLHDLDPGIGSCLAVLHWPGGRESLEEIALEQADAVIAYGGADTCADIARRTPLGTRLILHGPKLGMALIAGEVLTEEGIPEFARRLAYDVAMFDQQACLSPHWIFVEGGDLNRVRALADAMAKALRAWEDSLPRGRLSHEEAAAFSRAWDDAELALAMGEPVTIHSERRCDPFLVRVDRRRPIQPSCLGRNISIIPIGTWRELPELLAPFRGLMQNAALAVPADERAAVAEILAAMGVTRICPPGRMATPTMMWRHDGAPGLAALVRYCDMENET